MENIACSHNNNLVKDFKFFHKRSNLIVRKIMDSNLSPSDKLNSLISAYLQSNQGVYRPEIAFHLDLDRHNICLGRDMIKFANKDKIDDNIGGKIIYHGKISENDKDKAYKTIFIKTLRDNVSLFRATDLTNHDVRQIGYDMTHNISFKCWANCIDKMPKNTPNIRLKGTTTFNGTKYYKYLLRISIDYSNKHAFINFINQFANDAVSHLKFL